MSIGRARCCATVLLIAALILVVGGVPLGYAQMTALSGFVQQGKKVVGTGAEGVTAFGTSVTLSADGRTAVVGARAYRGYVGAVWVLSRAGTTWTSAPAPLVPTDAVENDRVGEAVAVSADGRVALVAGYGAWMFVRTGNRWVQQGARFQLEGAKPTSGFPYRVAVSSDGSTALVAAASDDGHRGAVWVFTRSGSQWIQSAKLMIEDEPTILFGRDVAISGDGRTVAIAGYRDGGVGPNKLNRQRLATFWVFEHSANGWNRRDRVIPPDENNAAQSIAISRDGRTILLGSNARAWFYAQASGAWKLQTTVTGSASSNFGVSVALSGDGKVALVGGHHFIQPRDRNRSQPNVGAAWAFVRVDGRWHREGTTLRAADARGPATFGESVALSQTGRFAVVGGPSDAGDGSNLAGRGRGAAWFFTRAAPR